MFWQVHLLGGVGGGYSEGERGRIPGARGEVPGGEAEGARRGEDAAAPPQGQRGGLPHGWRLVQVTRVRHKNIIFLVQSPEDQGRGPAAGQEKPGLAARRGQGGAEEAPPGPRLRALLARLDLHCGQEPIVKP